MKKVIFLLFVITLSASAQMEVSSTSAFIGKSAVSNGYDIVVGFYDKQGDNHLVITGNHQRVFGTYSWNIPSIRTTALITGGFFKNTPWLGPQLVIQPTDFLTLVSWYGIAAGVPEKPQWDIEWMVRYNSLSIHLPLNITVSTAFLKFVYDDTDILPGISIKNDLNHSWEYKVGVDYSMNNKEPMFVFGLSYSFSKN